MLKMKDSKGCLDYDSEFRLLKANINLFRQEWDDFGYDDAIQDNKELERAFGSTEQCRVLFCASRKNESAMLYPLYKQRHEDTGYLKHIHLITSETHTRKVEIENHSDQLLEAHFINSAEFGDSVDNLIEITTDRINIYKKEKHEMAMQPVMSIQGLNIRSVREIHESFLYTICDEISRPFSISKNGGEHRF